MTPYQDQRCSNGHGSAKPPENRPGLNALSFRIGTYQSFLATMTAALSQEKYPELRRFTSRSSQDPAMALVDAWATVADVLTFYQERIANEGFLRTALHRRSVVELSNLLGYQPRPGVAASAVLAYTLEKPRDPSSTGMESSAPPEIVVPAGTRAQTVPKPGDFPQTFETAEELRARPDWNELIPRKARPQLIIDYYTTVLYFKGTATNLKPNDPLVVVFPPQETREPSVSRLWKVQVVEPDEENKRTKVTLQNREVQEDVSQKSIENHGGIAGSSVLTRITRLFEPLAKPPALHPYRSADLQRNLSDLFATQPRTGASDTEQRTNTAAAAGEVPSLKAVQEVEDLDGDLAPRIASQLHRDVGQSLYAALRSATVTEENKIKVYALRVVASPFGHNAPRKPVLNEKGIPMRTEEWPLFGAVRTNIILNVPSRDALNAGGSVVLSDPYETVSYSFEFPLQNPQISPAGDNWRVTVERRSEADSYVYEFQVTRSVLAFARRFSISVQGNIIEAAIGDRPPIIVGVGQSMTSSKGGESTTVSRDEQMATIVNESRLQASGDVKKTLTLDAPYDQITPATNTGEGGWIAIERPNDTILTQVDSARRISRADYGISARVTELRLKSAWLNETDGLLSDIRDTAIYAQSELLELAEEPVSDDVANDEIELDTVYSGLESGRWIIVEGERTDIEGTSGVKNAELVMLAKVTQQFCPTLPDDRLRTHLHFSHPLQYSYKRSTVIIYGNVVRATHGETRKEVIGGGDGSKSFQQFALKQFPLTYVPAPTPAGVKSTLEIRVNNVRWHEVENFHGIGANDRAYISDTDDDEKTKVVFGNGINGARVPTGTENVEAHYRTGIGKAGNVDAQQISLLLDRPLGVKGVLNPLRSSGGADAESKLNIRRNAPIAVLSLGRLVSVLDYADFARAFAGVGKASAQEVIEGTSRFIHLTIAGVNDIPIDEMSELYRNLKLAFMRNGDPHFPVQIASREVMFIVIAAKVRVGTEYVWSSVSAKIRDALIDRYSFDHCDFGQDVFLSDVITTIQSVEGVDFVDVDVLDKVEEPKNYANKGQVEEDLKDLVDDLKRIASSKRQIPKDRIVVNFASRNKRTGVLRPAQLAYLNSEIQDTLILTEIR